MGVTFGDYTVPAIQKIIDLGVRLIYSFHMPLFFALSGSLFYLNVESNKFNNLRDVLSVKAKRLLIPYVFCTFFGVIPIKALSGYWSNSASLLKDIIFGQFFYMEIHIFGFCGFCL